MWLFLTVPGVGLQCVIVVFSDRTHLRFEKVDFEEKKSPNDKTVLTLSSVQRVNYTLARI